MIIDEEVYLEHYGAKGMKWGVHKSASKRSSEKASKPSRKERKASEIAALRQRGKDMVNFALKEPQSLLVLNRRTIVTGEQFVQHLSNGGLLDPRGSSVYARQLDGPKGPYTRTDRDGGVSSK